MMRVVSFLHLPIQRNKSTLGICYFLLLATAVHWDPWVLDTRTFFNEAQTYVPQTQRNFAGEKQRRPALQRICFFVTISPMWVASICSNMFMRIRRNIISEISSLIWYTMTQCPCTDLYWVSTKGNVNYRLDSTNHSAVGNLPYLYSTFFKGSATHFLTPFLLSLRNRIPR